MQDHDLSYYKLKRVHDWASLVFVRIYEDVPLPCTDASRELKVSRTWPGYVLVIEPKRRNPVYKLAGGHRKNGETPLQTAIRELEGETGIPVPAEAFRYVNKWLHFRRDHWKMLFTADVSHLDMQRRMSDLELENEGEQPKFFTVAEFCATVRDGKVMQDHYDHLVEFAVVLPMCRDRVA